MLGRATKVWLMVLFKLPGGQSGALPVRGQVFTHWMLSLLNIRGKNKLRNTANTYMSPKPRRIYE